MKIKDNSRKISESVESELEARMIIAGDFLEGEAKLRCPVDTDNLRDSINSTVIKTGKKIKLLVGSPVSYAPYVELGKGKKKNPTEKGGSALAFLRPALFDNEEKVRSFINGK